MGDIALLHVGTNEQVADIFTKAMDLDKLRTFSIALGLQTLHTPSLRGTMVNI